MNKNLCDYKLTIDEAKELIAKGENANERVKGYNALGIALKNNNVELVKSLIEAGADVNALLERGYERPLNYALCEPTTEMIEVLIYSGAIIAKDDIELAKDRKYDEKIINILIAKFDSKLAEELEEKMWKMYDKLEKEEEYRDNKLEGCQESIEILKYIINIPFSSEENILTRQIDYVEDHNNCIEEMKELREKRIKAEVKELFEEFYKLMAGILKGDDYSDSLDDLVNSFSNNIYELVNIRLNHFANLNTEYEKELHKNICCFQSRYEDDLKQLTDFVNRYEDGEITDSDFKDEYNDMPCYSWDETTDIEEDLYNYCGNDPLYDNEEYEESQEILEYEGFN